VIFIDEIDSLGTSRDHDTHNWTSSHQTELFVQIDGMGNDNTDVLLIGATNIPWKLDMSLRRRFVTISSLNLVPVSSAVMSL